VDFRGLVFVCEPNTHTHTHTHSRFLVALRGVVEQHFRDAQRVSDGQFAFSRAGRWRIMLILISRLLLMTAVWRVAEGKVTSRFICVCVLLTDTM